MSKPLKPLKYMEIESTTVLNEPHKPNDFVDYFGKQHEDLFAKILNERGFTYKRDEIPLDKPENRSQLYDFLVENITVDIKAVFFDSVNAHALIRVKRQLKCDFYVFFWLSKKKFVYASKQEIVRWNVRTFGKLDVPTYAEPLSNLHPIDELIEILLKSKKIRLQYENYGMPDHKIRDMIRCKLLLKNK